LTMFPVKLLCAVNEPGIQASRVMIVVLLRMSSPSGPVVNSAAGAGKTKLSSEPSRNMMMNSVAAMPRYVRRAPRTRCHASVIAGHAWNSSTCMRSPQFSDPGQHSRSGLNSPRPLVVSRLATLTELLLRRWGLSDDELGTDDHGPQHHQPHGSRQVGTLRLHVLGHVCIGDAPEECPLVEEA